MESLNLKNYEISVWNDILTFVVEDRNGETPVTTTTTVLPEQEYIVAQNVDFSSGERYYYRRGVDPNTEYVYTEVSLPGVSTYYIQRYLTKKQFYAEEKVCVIGSSSMTSPAKIFDPVFTENINGTQTLTFSLYYRYFDPISAEYLDNPFVDLLINERKIKLFFNPENEGDEAVFDNGWHDLIIKNVQENARNYTYSYTAQSASINELSKTGFNLEFDPELQNNMGTITELAEKVVDGTDWRIRPVGAGSDLLAQYIEEPVYWYDLQSGDTLSKVRESDPAIPQGVNTVYIFYSQLQEQSDGSYLEKVYAALPCVEDGQILINDNRVLLNADKEYAQNVFVTLNSVPLDQSHYGLTDYRGMRLNHHQTTIFDNKIGRYVDINTYEEDGEEKTAYHFNETQYISPTVVQNFITNDQSFTHTGGWDCNAEDVLELGFQKANNQAESYLKLTSANNGYLYNSGIYDTRSKIHDFTQGEEYVVRVNASDIDDLSIFIGEYSFRSGVYTLEQSIFDLDSGVQDIDYEFVIPVWNDGRTYYYYDESTSTYRSTPEEIQGIDVYYKQVTYQKFIATCTESKSYEQLLDYDHPIGFFIRNTHSASSGNPYEWLLYRCQFYQRVEDDGKDLRPGDAPTQEIINIIPRYYNPEANEYDSVDDLVFLPADLGYTPIYDDTYEKIRSITIKESNRFNIIQTLCETFECWAKFEVAHDKNGNILLDEDYAQEKYISFHEYIGVENDLGFRYGINLKDITRTLVSDQLVTKIIVKPNNNEFGINGMCTIARASENYPKENFILDFIHYIQHGLLNSTEITNDLYLDSNGYIGYYKKLAQLNKLRDEHLEILVPLQTAENQLKSAVSVATLTAQSAEQEYNNAMHDYYMYQHTDYPGYDDETRDTLIQEIQTTIEVFREAANKWGAQSIILNQQWEDVKAKIEEEDNILNNRDNPDSIISQKEALNAQFYKKYSRFIQEGSWTSEDYVDDNLYFIDAQNTLRTSAEPQVTYNISVMALDALDEYQIYKFGLGDKTYVEDEEYFGYVMKGDGVPTPYHEEVIVSAIQWNLDDPSTNNITVQNYKTRFQDLFQRIAAQTQNLQYSAGGYERAASAITTDGAIQEDVLGKSMFNSNFVLSNARDQSVVLDSDGITITDLANYREIVRLVSGGIFLSNDGGKSWSNAVTGRGINANYLNAGQIDTALIRVGNGSFPSFRWDANGISAYTFNQDAQGNPISFLTDRMVRYDQYGLYGIREKDFVPTDIDDVWDNAQFALTWQGFKINSNNDSGYVSITSDNDFQVIKTGGQTDIEKIKIGRIAGTGVFSRAANPSATDGRRYFYYDESDSTYKIFTDWDNYNPDSTELFTQDWVYGIKIANDDGASVMESDDQGNLWLKNTLLVGDGSNQQSAVLIGYNPNAGYVPAQGQPMVHEVINANNDFIVYEDGSIVANNGHFSGDVEITSGSITIGDNFSVTNDGTMTATDGNFTGTIHATGGTIGNVDIDVIEESVQRVVLNSTNGTVITRSNNIAIPNTLNFTASLIGIDEQSYNSTYNWYYFYNSIWTQIASTSTPALQWNVSGLTTSVLVRVEFIGIKSGSVTPDIDIYSNSLEISISDATSYEIVFNDDKITPFYKEDGTVNIEPSGLAFNIYKDGVELTCLPNTEYFFKLKVINDGGATTILDNSQSYASFYHPSESDLVINYISDTPPAEEDPEGGGGKRWVIDLATIVTNDPAPVGNTDDNAVYNIFRNALLGEYGNFGIEVYQAGQTPTLCYADYIVIVNPVEEALMNFSVHAQSIDAAIADRLLEFSQDGLLIANTGLTIVARDNTSGIDTPLLYFDNDKKELCIEGNITAHDGSFSGTIEAKAGVIEFLTIGNQNEANYLQLGNFDDNSGAGIRSSNNNLIITQDGHIEANDIVLGDSAVIKTSLTLGNSALRQPTDDDRRVFHVGDGTSEVISISDDGTGFIGSLVFDGANSVLSSDSWSITPQKAVFNDIVASGTISAAIFESNTTRVSGGSMIFKGGSQITDIESGINSTDITVEDRNMFNTGDYVLVVTNHNNLANGRVAQVIGVDESGTVITIDASLTENSYDTVLQLGPLASDDPNKTVLRDWLIGVNSTDNPIGSVGLAANAISFNQVSFDSENGVTYLPQIILGELNGLTYNSMALAGAGLYASNVYLTGSLTTQYTMDIGKIITQYAGISTNHNVHYNKKIDKQKIYSRYIPTDSTDFSNKKSSLYLKTLNGYTQLSEDAEYAPDEKYYMYQTDTSEIVFWSGADGTNDYDIQDALFQVTANGTLYAQQGYFEGSILSNSTIEASEIVTPIITGRAHSNKPLLTLQTPLMELGDDVIGFEFKVPGVTEDEDEKLVQFTTSNSIFHTPIIVEDGAYISVGEKTMIYGSSITTQTFIADVDMGGNTNTVQTQLTPDGLIFVNKGQENSKNIVGSLVYNNGTTPQLEVDIQGAPVFAYDAQKVHSYASTYLDSDVYYKNTYMSYQPSDNEDDIGYNLYVDLVDFEG